MLKRPKVLVVEDQPTYQRFYQKELEGQCTILAATSLKEGEGLYQEHPDISLVIMDACVPGGEPNSLPLLRTIRESFSGPIIAASAEPSYRKLLMREGCSHEADKLKVPALVKKILHKPA